MMTRCWVHSVHHTESYEIDSQFWADFDFALFPVAGH
jgi:hypothetical protein